jgi:cytochrome P450
VTTELLEFNPLAPEMAIDPYPHYKRLREIGQGVHQIAGLGMYVITRHADVAAFYKDRRLQMQYAAREQARYGPEVIHEPFYRYLQHTVFFQEEAVHRVTRQMFAHAFTMRRLDQLQSRISQLAHKLMARRLAEGGMELIEDYSDPFPRIIIGELLGIPEADNDRIGKWALMLGSAFEFLPMSPDRQKAVNESVEALAEYLDWLAERRTSEPQDDLYSGMLQAAAESDGAITREMVIANTMILYVGGHDTTSGAMGLSLLALNRQPDALAELKAAPSLVPAALDELLRFDVSTQGTGRIATEPVEYGGVEIPAGSPMLAYIGSALRDPDVYEDPDRIDFHRPEVKLISFAPGPHQCIGNMLARREITAFLEALISVLPDHRLATLDPPFREFPLLRGVARLDVEW